MLERYAMKVARTVLRGGSGSNTTSLPDQLSGEVRARLSCSVWPAPLTGPPPAEAGVRKNPIYTEGVCLWD